MHKSIEETEIFSKKEIDLSCTRLSASDLALPNFFLTQAVGEVLLGKLLAISKIATSILYTYIFTTVTPLSPICSW